MGNYFFGFIGAVIKWFFYLLLNLILRKEYRSFKEIWNGPEYEDPIDGVSYEISNTIIGFIVIVIIGFCISGVIHC